MKTQWKYWKVKLRKSPKNVEQKDREVENGVKDNEISGSVWKFSK